MYQCLLADVRVTYKVPIGSPDVTLEWVLKEGPRLDKDMLRFFEFGGEPPCFPEWLAPLWERAYTCCDTHLFEVLRTVLGFCYKAEYEPTQQQIRDAEEAFLDVEDGIRVWDESHDLPSDPFYRRVRVLVHQVLKRATMDEFQSSMPSHGPGAVFPSRVPQDKSNFSTSYRPVQRFYAWDQWFQGVFTDSPGLGDFAEEEFGTCRMVAVPKDARGPRLICVHPAELIWIQQSQRKVVERVITSSPLTSGFINFDDQSVNGALALRASRDREFCTLDLKEASDRLSLKLVSYLLGSWADVLEASRARDCKLLSGRIVTLRKFAPMGNCLTFPIESLIFWAIAHIAMGGGREAPVYVFGDDILFPSSQYEEVIRRLVMAGLVPNRLKTFRRGFFRESCGVDALWGVDITPLRTKVGGCRTYAQAESLCSLARRAEERGYRFLPDGIYAEVRRFMGTLGKPLGFSNNPSTQGVYQYVRAEFGELITKLDGTPGFQIRFNSNLQRWETRYHRVAPLQKEGPWSSWWNLLDSLVRLESREASRDEPGERGLSYAVPNRSQLQLGWTPVLMNRA